MSQCLHTDGVYEPLHPVCTVPFHFVCHMTVYIQGKSYSSMTEAFGNGLDIIPILDADSSIGVAEVMEAEIRKANSYCPPF